MKIPVTLNFTDIPEVIIGTFEIGKKVEQAIIDGDLVFAPAYRVAPDGIKELKAISLVQVRLMTIREDDEL